MALGKVIRAFSAFCSRLRAGYARSFEAIRLNGGLSHPTIAPVIASSGLELIKHVWALREALPKGNLIAESTGGLVAIYLAIYSKRERTWPRSVQPANLSASRLS